MKLHEKIKDLRSRASLTQNECARRAGVSSQEWARFESDKFENPRMFTVRAIAKALGVEMGELVKNGGANE